MSTGIGETLRTARQQRGVTLSDAAEETAISKRKLAALEEEQFAELEGDVYVRSSLRLYSRFLGIDPEPLVHQYRSNYGDVVADGPVLPIAEYRDERISPVVLFAIVALVAIIGLGVVGSITSRAGEADRGQQVAADAPGPEPVVDPTPSTDATAEPTAEPEPEPEPTGPPPLSEAERVELALNVNGGASWVRVTVDDEQTLEETLQDGFSQTFRGDQIRMRIGNGGAAEVVVNGEQLQQFSTGEVVDLTCEAGQESCTVETVN